VVPLALADFLGSLEFRVLQVIPELLVQVDLVGFQELVVILDSLVVRDSQESMDISH
jgi:hypothetical protein